MAPPRDAAPPADGSGSPVDARVIRTRNDILRATLEVLTSQGLDGLTHPHLAEVAGYSRSAEHSTPTGDLRSDLIAELTMFRTEMERHGLDRALAVLAAVTAFTPELAEVRDQLLTDGELVMRELLSPAFQGDELDAAVLMLTGAVINSAVVHGQLPSDALIAATVDLVLRPRGL